MSIALPQPTHSPPAAPLPIETRDSADLPYDVFVRDYMAKNRPVVVTRSTRDWPALSKWTPEFFKTRFGSRKVQVSYEEAMTFSDFIDGVLASTNERPGPYMYRLFIHESMPELLEDLAPQNPYSFPRRYASPLMRTHWRRPDGYLKLLIGGLGGRFPVIHFDGENAHATITEIYGDKEFLMYAPGDGQYLYPNPKIPNKSLIVDPLRVDPERFPLQARATQYGAVLHPGDMVFVPCGWWHTARALGPSISVGMNIMDSSNFDGFVSQVFGANGRPLTGRRALNWMYWTGVGRILSALEQVQERLPAVARATVLPQLLAPASSAVARDPSTMKLRVPPRED
jgi:hypothetical protein